MQAGTVKINKMFQSGDYNTAILLNLIQAHLLVPQNSESYLASIVVGYKIQQEREKDTRLSFDPQGDHKWEQLAEEIVAKHTVAIPMKVGTKVQDLLV